MPTECKRLEQLLKRMVPVLLNWASSLKELFPSQVSLANQGIGAFRPIRISGRRVLFWVAGVCVCSPWPTGVRVGPAFIAGIRSSEENVGELGSCAMVSEGPLSLGGEGRWLSHRSRCDGCSLGLGRGRQPAKQPRPWARGLWAAPPLGRFCAEQGSSKRLRPALGTLGLVTSQVCRRSEPMLFLSGGLVAKSRYS